MKKEKLRLQAKKLKEQAQIDLEGYVTSRAALKTTRQDLKAETLKYDSLKAEYDLIKDKHESHKMLREKAKEVRKSKKHIRELSRLKKRYRRDMRDHREGVRKRLVTGLFAIIAFFAMISMIVWRIYQLSLGVYYLAFYINGETAEAVLIAILRQLLHIICIVYGLMVIWQSIQVWSMGREGFYGALRIKVKEKAYWLMILGVPLQLISHGDILTNVMMLVTIISQMVMASLLSIEKSKRGLVKVFSVLYLAGISVIALYSVVVCRNFEFPTDETGTSVIPSDNKTYLAQLWEMSTESEFYHMGVYGQDGSNEYDLTVIPGLLYAETLKSGRGGAVSACTSMTPQGIAVTEKYTFVSAYCGVKGHKSVIYVLDTKSGEYIKTLVLKNTTHAGGLAYDEKNNVLWVSSYIESEGDNEKRKASISCLTLSSIEAYDFDKEHVPITYRNTCKVMFPATSFITIYDGRIYAGYWKKDKNTYSMAASYEIINGGVSISDEPAEAFYIPGRVQGLQVYKNEIIFSISYGIDESKIEVYDIVSGKLSGVNYKDETPRQELKLPQKLEQIYSYNGKLYCLFESGSFAYRLTAPVCMDRIVSLDEMTLVNGR